MARRGNMGCASRVSLDAQVAELADALASGASSRKGVEVRVLSWAPLNQCLTRELKNRPTVALDTYFSSLIFLPILCRRFGNTLYAPECLFEVMTLWNLPSTNSSAQLFSMAMPRPPIL